MTIEEAALVASSLAALVGVGYQESRRDPSSHGRKEPLGSEGSKA
jgi:hypothetical protein